MDAINKENSTMDIYIYTHMYVCMQVFMQYLKLGFRVAMRERGVVHFRGWLRLGVEASRHAEL